MPDIEAGDSDGLGTGVGGESESGSGNGSGGGTGTASAPGNIGRMDSLGGFPLVRVDPRYNIPSGAHPNSYRCPLGAEPGRAWVLMLRKHATALFARANAGDGSVSLTFRATKKEFVTFPRLYPLKGYQVSGGDIDGDAVYLVELVDARYMAQQFASGDATFNSPWVMAPALQTNNTQGSGALWTWQLLIDYLWAQNAPGGAGNLFGVAAPTLPFSPDGTPSEIRTEHTNGWQMLTDVLDKLACAVAYDPLEDEYSIVRLGTTQEGLARAEGLHLYLDTAGPLVGNVATYPFAIRVQFRTMPRFHNVTEATPTDYVVVPTGLPSIAWNVLTVQDDMIALSTNQAALSTRAAEVAAAKIEQLTAMRSRRLYQGLIDDILPGSEVACVWWRNFGDGYCTEVLKSPVRSPSPEFGSPLAALDVAHHLRRLYTNEECVVRFSSAPTIGEQQGSYVVPDEDTQLYDGEILELNPLTSEWTVTGQCWLRLMDAGEDLPIKLVGTVRPGRFFGATTFASQTLPIVGVHLGATLYSGVGAGGWTVALDGEADSPTVSVQESDAVAAANTIYPAIREGDAVYMILQDGVFHVVQTAPPPACMSPDYDGTDSIAIWSGGGMICGGLFD